MNKLDWETSARAFFDQFVTHCAVDLCEGCEEDMEGILEYVEALKIDSFNKGVEEGRERAVNHILKGMPGRSSGVAMYVGDARDIVESARTSGEISTLTPSPEEKR